MLSFITPYKYGAGIYPNRLLILTVIELAAPLWSSGTEEIIIPKIVI